MSTIDNLTIFAPLDLLLMARLVKIDCDPLNQINQLGKLGSLSLSFFYFLFIFCVVNKKKRVEYKPREPNHNRTTLTQSLKLLHL